VGLLFMQHRALWRLELPLASRRLAAQTAGAAELINTKERRRAI
jgi:hypothetical protein